MIFKMKYTKPMLKLSLVLLGLTIALLLRIVVPYVVLYQYGGVVYSRKMTTAVIHFYIGIIGTIWIILFVFPISIVLSHVTQNWITLAYLPLLKFTCRWTYSTFKRLYKSLGHIIEAEQDNLDNYWWNYFNYNDTLWSDIEKSSHCCGMTGPRDYMEYMQRVPAHCYNPQLIIRGCGDRVSDTVAPAQRIGYFLLIIVVLMQFCLLCTYACVAIRRLWCLPGKFRLKKNFLVKQACKSIYSIFSHKFGGRIRTYSSGPECNLSF